MKMVNKSCLVQQMTEKYADEVDAKISFGKKCKNQQVFLFKGLSRRYVLTFWPISHQGVGLYLLHHSESDQGGS